MNFEQKNLFSFLRIVSTCLEMGNVCPPLKSTRKEALETRKNPNILIQEQKKTCYRAFFSPPLKAVIQLTKKIFLAFTKAIVLTPQCTLLCSLDMARSEDSSNTLRGEAMVAPAATSFSRHRAARASES